MRVLIDEGMTTFTKPTGIGLQGINLYKHLRKYCDCDLTDFWYLKLVPRIIRRFCYVAIINIQVIYKKYDVIHYQNGYAPLTKGISKKFVTIHDLGAFLFPDTVPFIWVKYNQHSIIKALERADGIITPSKAIKNEILELFPGTDSDKIFQCNDGIRDIFWNFQNDINHLRNYNVKPYSYFFFLGSLSRRKNLKFILEVFIKAKKQNLINKETLLVLGGQQWWGSGDFKHLLKEENGIKTLGYLDDVGIVQFYKNSKALIFPSLYEGFGMPIIEAMSQNIPIIISNIPTSIELNGNHNNQMFGFDLDNESELLNHLILLDKDHEIIRSQLNYGDLSNYRFDNIATEHLKIYNQMLNRSK